MIIQKDIRITKWQKKESDRSLSNKKSNKSIEETENSSKILKEKHLMDI